MASKFISSSTYDLTAGTRLSYKHAAFRIFPREQFAASTARDVAKTIRDLQKRGPNCLINMTISPGNTVIGVLGHLATIGAVPKEKILLRTPLKPADLPAFFEEPITDNLFFREGLRSKFSRYIEETGMPSKKLQGLLDMWYGCEKEKIKWPGVRFIHMAEYRGAAASGTFSFASYMRRFFFDLMHPSNRILENNIVCISPEQDGATYLSDIGRMGGIDIAVVSMGANGHVAYNEPGSPETSRFRCVQLSPETVAIKDRDIPSLESSPYAYTMGIADLLEAGHLFLLGSGKEKSGIVRRTLFNPPSSELPASFLTKHPTIRINIDLDAAAELPPSYQKLLTKACDNLHNARHLLLNSPLAERLDKADLTRLSEVIASSYLDRVIDPEKTSELLTEFAGSELLIDYFDAFMQTKILRFYVEHSSQLLSAAKERSPLDGEPQTKEQAAADKRAKKQIEELFRRAFRVYRFPETKDNVIERKRIVYNLIYINIMSSFMPTASIMRMDVAVSSTIENALSNNDPAMFKPALELIFEILAVDKRRMFFVPFMAILKRSSSIPRFAKAIQDLLLDAKDGKVAFIHNDRSKGEVLSAEEFLERTIDNIAAAADEIPILRSQLSEYMRVLGEKVPERNEFAQEIISRLRA